MVTEKVFLEILRIRLKSIAEEMAAVTLRTGFTVYVKETADFAPFLTAPDGEVIAAPTDTCVSAMLGTPAWEVINALGDYEEGDIGICNDPDATHGLSTHLPDIWTWMPIFADGEIIAYGFNFIHSSDVGGRVPGSIALTNSEIFQEGLRIPPTKLFRHGKLNEDLIKLILLNCRIPEQNWGDIKAQVAALHLAKRRILELTERYGRERVQAGIRDLRDYAEEQAREIISGVPDGSYSFIDYMEGGAGPLQQIRIKATMNIRGSDMIIDFDGTDYQVPVALNVPTWNQPGHYEVTYPIVNFFVSLRPDIPYNSGLVRPIRMSAERGTLLNPDPGVAVGVRAATSFRLLDILTGCLAQALPNVFPAAGSGAISIVLIATLDPTTGERKVEVAQPLNGGSGGRPNQEAIDGASFAGGWLRNIPNEVLETDVPILVEEYGYRVGSGGPGERRGGCGIRFRVRILAPQAVLAVRGLERFVFRPWGLLGGKPGALAAIITNPGTDDEANVGKVDTLTLRAGEVAEFFTAGAGGYGEPLRRAPELVLRDVQDGLVESAEAEAAYGVVIEHAAVNRVATEELRRTLAPSRYTLIDVGDERRSYEEFWTDEIMTELLTRLAPYPSSLRPIIYSRLREDIRESGQLDGLEIAVNTIVSKLGIRPVGSEAQLRGASEARAPSLPGHLLEDGRKDL
jgi:N-methylhydantoinase B